jgi:Protein of unknown function, DUF547
VSGAASGVAMTVPSIAFANTANIDTRYGALLARYVVAGRDGVNRVAYGRWKANAADMTAIAGVVTGYEAIRPSTLSREARFAFWVNLYNALTLKVVLDAFPVRSIRNIGVGGPWRRALVTVEAHWLARTAHPLCGKLRLHRMPKPDGASLVCSDFGGRPRSRRPSLRQLTQGRARDRGTAGARVVDLSLV